MRPSVAGRLASDRILSEANELPAGFAPLIENYLRAISYEE